MSVTAHLTDGGIDVTKKCVKAGHSMVETFHCGQDALWPEDVFTDFFDMGPQEAGYQVRSYPKPTGDFLVRVPYDASETPVLPKGVILISKDFKIEVACCTSEGFTT